jgi:hypothetical protein
MTVMRSIHWKHHVPGRISIVCRGEESPSRHPGQVQYATIAAGARALGPVTSSLVQPSPSHVQVSFM